ncbi:hypothetical protein BC835DRAFT_1531265 [Cytidiella melzeri]|nr:hypothetical protein BC835DRAFT_1531265 [Cytidiella melzeri]
MQFSTFLTLIATVTIGILHTKTASAIPHNSAVTHSSSPSDNHTSLERLDTGTVDFTKPYQIVKRMPKGKETVSQEEFMDWVVCLKMLEPGYYKNGPGPGNPAEQQAWEMLKYVLSNPEYNKSPGVIEYKRLQEKLEEESKRQAEKQKKWKAKEGAGKAKGAGKAGKAPLLQKLSQPQAGPSREVLTPEEKARRSNILKNLLTMLAITAARMLDKDDFLKGPGKNASDAEKQAWQLWVDYLHANPDKPVFRWQEE